ncbi:hypothetical protein KIN20_026480 [Parelaphostrongylus tenuis]|uniref:Uncharacterized protein n=1 Tax=Parelaphostrongylus tenuis TaxID=148309 RepID=A0AAD5WD40_PARTN|nr:hypothetical protein KIN20_026480 [Parelaphostrongylus tenuis]
MATKDPSILRAAVFSELVDIRMKRPKSGKQLVNGGGATKKKTFDVEDLWKLQLERITECERLEMLLLIRWDVTSWLILWCRQRPSASSICWR